MKNKKILSILLAFALLFATFVQNFSGQETPEYEPKIFANATIDEDFCGRFVLVVMDKNVGGLNKRHSEKFFGNFPIKEIVDLTAYTETQVAELNEAIKNQQADMKNFRQILQIELPKDCKQNVLDVIAILEKVDGIISAEPNYNGALSSTPNDPEYTNGNQWGLNKINAPAAWSITTGNADVRVGVIDTGIAYHNDLTNVSNTLGRAFENGVPQSNSLLARVDTEGHGTGVASVIGAAWNDIGIAGVCQNVTLVPLKIDQFFYHAANNAIAAINYATATYNNSNTRIPILNVSFGWSLMDMPLFTNSQFNALRQAVSQYPGLLVASAGNNENDNDGVKPVYPASYGFPNIISVGATNSNDQRATGWPSIHSGSNYGATSVHLFAPGEDILTICARPNNSICNIITCTSTNQYPYCFRFGTSFAAPHVAGVAALILSKYPNATPTHIKGAIMGSVDRGGFSGLCVAEGRLNARRALENMARYGIFHIRMPNNDSYLSMVSPGVNNSTVWLTTYSNINAQKWIVQQLSLSGYHTIHSFDSIGGNKGSLALQSVYDVVVQTTSTTMSLTYNADDTVTFDIYYGPRLTASGSSAVWVQANSYYAQKWCLDHHPDTYKQGDVNQDGVITTADRNLVQAHLNGTITLTAVQFYLADVLRDGRITQADVDFINTMIA